MQDACEEREREEQVGNVAGLQLALGDVAVAKLCDQAVDVPDLRSLAARRP